MKYRYKISYGGTSSKSDIPQIFNPVKELNDLFEIISQHKSNYKDYTESNFFKDLKEDNKNLEELYAIYNDDEHGKIYDEEKYKIVTDEQLDNLIPRIEDLYTKNAEMPGNYVIKEYLSEKSKVIYLGDYHSSIHSLIIVIQHLQSMNILKDNYELNDNYYIVFLGDIVDRGPYGIECLYIIYLLFYINNQVPFKHKIFVLNGNHEEKHVYKKYGFENEMKNQLNSSMSKYNLEKIIQYLPLALFIKNNDNINAKWYQFCHGGIDIHQIRDDTIKNFLNSENNSLNNSLNLNYKVGDVMGFLWSDFADYHFLDDELIPNLGNYSSRDDPNIMMMDSFNRPVYNDYQVDKVLNDLNIMTIISGHQDLTNYAFILRKYPLDQKYFDHGLLTFDDNFSNINKIETDQFKNKDENKKNYFINFSGVKISNTDVENYNVDLSKIKLSDTDRKKFNQNNYLKIGGNINNFMVKSHKIRMETILASVMSSATISKDVPYSVFGILDLQNNESEIIYLHPNFEFYKSI